jgi:antitoxin component of RelBE/YafQ-DinJ toxin-antitoxin module
MKTEALNLRIQPEIKRQLQAIAKERGITLSKLVEGYLDILTESSADRVDLLIQLVERINAQTLKWTQTVTKSYKLLHDEIDAYESNKALYIDAKALKGAKRMMKEATAAMS